MGFPIYINVRDRLTMTKQLAEQCVALDDVSKIVLIDNDSSYPPLLEWYERCPFEVVKLGDNRGPRAPWTVLNAETYYVVTDCDLDLTGVPTDVLALYHAALEEHREIKKVGLSLKTDDIPDEYPFKKTVVANERSMQQSFEKDDRFLIWPIDTTFAMYRPNHGWGGYGPALRSKSPYMARHLPWYLTELDEEESYYLDHMSTVGPVWSSMLKGKRERDGKS